MIGTRRFRTIALTTGALLAAALPVSVPSAQADGGPTPTRAPRTVTQEAGHPVILYPGREGTAAAYCPQGTTPTGGGLTAASDPRSAVFFRESAPVGNRWRVRAYNSTNEVQTVHPTVICTTDSTVTQQVGADSSIQQGDRNGAHASCGNSQYVVGGGVQAGPLTFVESSGYNTIREWSVAAKYTDYDPDAPLSYVRAIAICSNSQPNLKINRVDLAAGAVGTAHVECPAGQVPTGGGGATGLEVLLNESAPTATGWTTRATNTSSGPRTASAEVFCTTP